MKITKEENNEKIPNIFERYDFIADFGQKLMQTYPDSQKCFLFHVLIGSTQRETENGYFDFPEENSIYQALLKWDGDENFFYESIKKYQQEKKEKGASK